ncbi:MAG: HU family DNA-binding protein [Lachnospiraceae bacterium]
MNKKELAYEVANKCGIQKKVAEKVVESVFETVAERVISGEEVQIVGFGTFETICHGARIGRNPKNGERVEIPESRKPKFRPAQGFKDKVKEVK